MKKVLLSGVCGAAMMIAAPAFAGGSVEQGFFQAQGQSMGAGGGAEALGEGNGLGGALNFLGWGDAGAEAGGHQGQVQGGYQSITFDDELAESKAFNKNDITITFPEDLQGDTKAQANGKGDDNANSVSGDDNEVQSAEGEKGAVVANLNSNAAMAEKGGNAAAGNANVFESFNVEQVNDTHLKTHNSGAPVMNIAKAYAGDAEGGDAEFENEADMGNKGYTGRNETEAENEHVDAGAGAEGENEDLGIGNSSANAGSGNLTAGDSDARAGSNMRADSEADANGGDVASEAWTRAVTPTSATTTRRAAVSVLAMVVAAATLGRCLPGWAAAMSATSRSPMPAVSSACWPTPASTPTSSRPSTSTPTRPSTKDVSGGRRVARPVGLPCFRNSMVAAAVRFCSQKGTRHAWA